MYLSLPSRIVSPIMSSEKVHHPSKRSQFNAYNFLVCFLVSLGQIAFGHPASIIGTTLGEPPFHVYMGLVDAQGMPTANSESLIGTMNGIFQVSLISHFRLFVLHT